MLHATRKLARPVAPARSGSSRPCRHSQRPACRHSDSSYHPGRSQPWNKPKTDPILSYLPAGRLAIDYFHNQCPSLEGLKEGENEAEWIVDLTTQASRGQRAVSRGGKGLGRLPKASPVEAAL